MITEIITNVELLGIGILLYKLVAKRGSSVDTTAAGKVEEAAQRGVEAVPTAFQPSNEDIKRADKNLVELLIRNGDEWAHHSWRPAGHPDIAKALADPEMAVGYVDRVIVEN